MKKTLLLGMAIATCFGSALADTKTPTIYEDGCFQIFSKDGRFLLSQNNGVLGVYDLVEGTVKNYGDGDMESYTIGHGNCITADGSIILASPTYAGAASYLKNGEFHSLQVLKEELSNSANGISADGSRIVGNIALYEMTFEDGILMQAPVYWDRNADGSYSDYHTLPYPDKDLFGETPQYLTAVAVSADGKVVVGQMVFGTGAMTIPVLYTEDNEGVWSYSLPTKDLFNPDKLEPVENPGDGPMGPYYMDYMTEEEYAAYEEALDAYYASWGSEEALPYPLIEDFMSPEKRAEYEAAQEAYEKEYMEWAVKSEAYYEYYYGVIESSPNFQFNNVFMSTDNKQIIGTVDRKNPNPTSWFDSTISSPAVIDIATGELTIIQTTENCLVSGVADNGVIFGYSGQQMMGSEMRGYIIQNGEVTNIQAYLTSLNPSYGEWIVENMTHPVIVGYDPDTYEDITEERVFTGMPISTPDMSKIAFWTNAQWGWDYGYTCEGVVFEFPKTPTGINTIVAAKDSLKFVNGALVVPAEFVSVDIYNLSGACVKSIAKASGAVKLDLSNGAYIAKGTRADGSVSVIKIAK